MKESFLRKLGKDTLLYMPAQFIPGIVGFLSVIIYTRLLNPDEYGRYMLVLYGVIFLSTLTISWVEQSLVRYYEFFKNKNESVKILSNVFFASFSIVSFISIAGIIFIQIAVVSGLISSKLAFLLHLSVVVYCLMSLIKVFFQLLRARRQAGLYSILKSAEKLLMLGLAVSLIAIMGRREEGIFIGMNIACFLILLVFLVKFFSVFSELKLVYFSPDLLKKLFIYGSPWIFITLGAFSLSYVDRYFIQHFLTTEAVGIYSATYSLAEKGILYLGSIMSISSYPLLLQSFEQNGEKVLAKDLNSLLNLNLLLLFPALLGILSLRHEIVNLFLGSGFRGTGNLFFVISIGAFFESLRLTVGRPLLIKNKTAYFAVLYITAGIINIILNIILIPVFGVMGAGYATLGGYFAYFALIFIITSFYFKWKIERLVIIKSFIGGAGMFYFLSIFYVNFKSDILELSLKIFLSMMVYFFILTVLREKYSLKCLKQIIVKMNPNKR